MFDIKHAFIFGKENFEAAQKASCEAFTLDVDEGGAYHYYTNTILLQLFI